VVQLYLTDLEASVTVPRWELKAFEKISLKPKQKKTVQFILTPRQMALIDNEGTCRLEPGTFRVFVGGSQPDELSKKLTGSAPLAAEFEVTGEGRDVPY
jgi:beta-glucosidase